MELFEHNQIAYDAVKNMLKETGKAAVIHPTGTAKSFIAFKLAEENPSACFCWLSPSEYIFKTQTENLKKAAGIVPGNIQFSSRTEYMQFQRDNSAHLKLLFCIDMLNEGIHVDDLDGVILFRPTESPIIYKQQIGRALSASGKHTPVIFDLVNNVDHLYAISALRAEMEEVISYYRNHHREKDIVHSDFQVIDEVREYKELFDQLEATLTASWDMMYAEAAAFYRANGHLDIPRRFRTEANLALGNWLNAQKRRYYAGKLEEDRMKCLLQIGADWIDMQSIIPASDARMHPSPRKNQIERINRAV